MSQVTDRLTELGLELPPPPKPVASYVSTVASGGFVYVSGQVAFLDGELLHPGKLGHAVHVEQGQEAARRAALQAISALQAELGDLDKVRRIVKVSVFVASGDGFTEQPAVANGASDLLAEVFGEAGKHAREAVGVAELPLGASVEVSLIAETG
jgi:enamine deaminase RidA (YjgF/YER057c/UK114 family)